MGLSRKPPEASATAKGGTSVGLDRKESSEPGNRGDTTATLRLRPTQDPPEKVPGVALVRKTDSESAVLQRASLLNSYWLEGSKVVSTKVRGVPWPTQTRICPPADGDDLRVVFATAALPTSIEVRFFESVGNNGIPSDAPVAHFECDSQRMCGSREGDGYEVPLSFPPGARQSYVTVWATWFVSSGWAKARSLAVSAPLEFSATWLFSVRSCSESTSIAERE